MQSFKPNVDYQSGNAESKILRPKQKKLGKQEKNYGLPAVVKLSDDIKECK